MIRTRNLLIWSQTRYHCATESAVACSLFVVIKIGVIFSMPTKGKTCNCITIVISHLATQLSTIAKVTLRKKKDKFVTLISFGDRYNLLVWSQIHYHCTTESLAYVTGSSKTSVVVVIYVW